jgi:hypothetical protein
MLARIHFGIFIVLMGLAGVMFAPGLFGEGSDEMIFKAPTEVPCPNREHALFTVTVPAKWKVMPQVVADCVTLKGPRGTMLYLRVAPGPLDAIMEEGRDTLAESYKTVTVDKPRIIKLGGLDATVMTGRGVRKEDEAKADFSLAWVTLPGGQIAEIWRETSTVDANELAHADEIRESFKVAGVEGSL